MDEKKIYTAMSKAWGWIARSPKLIAGAALIVTGVCFGCYVGFYWCLVGGIIDIFTAFKGENVAVSMLAFGLLKCLFAGFSGWGSAALFIVPGFMIISSDKEQVFMATKKKPIKLKAVMEEPEYWTVKVKKSLRVPFTEIAKSLGMTVNGAASLALDQWRREQQEKLIKMQAEEFIAGDGKEKAQ